MIRIFGTVLAGLLGLACGSFLNVCLSRWPAGESVVKPRSHCRSCGRTLAWWENVPLASWLALRGRCRTCGARIAWRYPMVELAVGGLWAIVAWQFTAPSFENQFLLANPVAGLVAAAGKLIFCWLLVALALLDMEHLWLPDWLTFPGIVLGLIVNLIQIAAVPGSLVVKGGPISGVVYLVLSAVAAAGLVLLIRGVYWLVRRREGIGLGDAKLMAMLGAWLGLPGALLAFAIGVGLGAVTALVLLAVPAARRGPQTWALTKLPLGTFLCVGGIASGLWGQQILAAYLRWSGLG